MRLLHCLKVAAPGSTWGSWPCMSIHDPLVGAGSCELWAEQSNMNLRSRSEAQSSHCARYLVLPQKVIPSVEVWPSARTSRYIPKRIQSRCSTRSTTTGSQQQKGGNNSDVPKQKNEWTQNIVCLCDGILLNHKKKWGLWDSSVGKGICCQPWWPELHPGTHSIEEPNPTVVLWSTHTCPNDSTHNNDKLESVFKI